MLLKLIGSRSARQTGTSRTKRKWLTCHRDHNNFECQLEIRCFFHSRGIWWISHQHAVFSCCPSAYLFTETICGFTWNALNARQSLRRTTNYFQLSSNPVFDSTSKHLLIRINIARWCYAIRSRSTHINIPSQLIYRNIYRTDTYDNGKSYKYRFFNIRQVIVFVVFVLFIGLAVLKWFPNSAPIWCCLHQRIWFNIYLDATIVNSFSHLLTCHAYWIL